jgi:hypothetical protein
MDILGVETYSLASSAKQHELSSSKFLDGKDGDERGEEVLGTVQRSKKTAEKARKADTVFKDSSCVIL